MIKVKKGFIEIEGTLPDALAEFSVITSGLMNCMAEEDIPADDAEDMIKNAVKVGLKYFRETKDEPESKNIIDDFLDDFFRMRGGKHDGDN